MTGFSKESFSKPNTLEAEFLKALLDAKQNNSGRFRDMVGKMINALQSEYDDEIIIETLGIDRSAITRILIEAGVSIEQEKATEYASQVRLSAASLISEEELPADFDEVLESIGIVMTMDPSLRDPFISKLKAVIRGEIRPSELPDIPANWPPEVVARLYCVLEGKELDAPAAEEFIHQRFPKTGSENN